MVGSRNRTVDKRCDAANTTTRKNPINDPSVLQKRPRCRWLVVVRERVLKLSAGDCTGCWTLGYIHIEVARKQNYRIRGVSLTILQNFLQLSETQWIIPSTFQMDVVGSDCFACNTGVTDQRQAPSEPLLKGRDFGKQPVRLPEMRLFLEPDNAGI